MRRIHNMPFGTRRLQDAISFQLWAPSAANVKLCLYGDEQHRSLLEMEDAGNGRFVIQTATAEIGTRYHFLIDGNLLVPDPASRFQFDDVHGPSLVVDPLEYEWTDTNWITPDWEETILYELHVGSFTVEGTFRAAAKRLDHLVELGITAIELMPIADFPGRWGWGYDGVLLYAPHRRYGSPADFKYLIDQAHQRGLMVFLDVVYNHFGPDGNYLWVYAKPFFNDRYETPWGSAINFDGLASQEVRRFFIHNALYWLEEYNLDGLRLDAVHAIHDNSSTHILHELADTVNQQLGPDRRIHLCLENDRNAASWLERDSNGRSKWFASQWNDDVHHALHVVSTGETSGYYEDYAESTSNHLPIEHLGRCLTQGFSYQGNKSAHRGGIIRGEDCASLPASAFVSFLQNHDQIGNRAFGERITCLAEPQTVKAALSLLILAPQVPMLFMGEEFGLKAPFLLFCDLEERLAPLIREGRRREFAKFPQFNDSLQRLSIPDPCAEATFRSCVLDWAAFEEGDAIAWLEFYKRLIALRKEFVLPALRHPQNQAGSFACKAPGLLGLNCKLGQTTSLALLANLSEQEQRVDYDLSAFVAQGIDICDLGNVREKLSSDKPLSPWSVLWVLKNDCN